MKEQTSFSQPFGYLLKLLPRFTGQDVQHFGDAAPTGSMKQLGKSDTERCISAVHIRDIVWVLRDKEIDNKLNN